MSSNTSKKVTVANFDKSNYTYAPIDEQANNGQVSEEKLANLDLGIGPDLICHRTSGGGKVAYGEGNKIIQLANETFGFNGWNTTLRQFTVDFVEQDDRNRVDIGATALIRVTLRDGSHREDFGYGTASNMPGKGAAYEKVRKECVTDGVKRALRQFGWLFMSAYDTTHMAEVSKRYKSVRRQIEPSELYHGKSGLDLKKSAKEREREQQEKKEKEEIERQAMNTDNSNNNLVVSNANNVVQNTNLPQPIACPTPKPQPQPQPQANQQPAPPQQQPPQNDIPSSPPADFDDQIDEAILQAQKEGIMNDISQPPPDGNSILPSDDFADDDLDRIMDQRMQQENQPSAESFNPINENNEDKLLHFTHASQAEQQQNLEQAEKFNTDTPNKFHINKSIPIKRNILDSTSASNTNTNTNNISASPSLSQSKPTASSQRFAKPTTPLVRKRPLQDRTAGTVNTPSGIGISSSNSINTEDAYKRAKVSPPE